MTIRSTPIKTAVAALCATAAIATVAAGTAAAATGHPSRHDGPRTAAASLPVVIACGTKQHQVKPTSYILACGDGSVFITKMHWAAWGGQAAFGSGTFSLRVCIPSCVAGKTVTFPILAALWRVKPLPGHRSVHYFTRLTLIYTGNRAYSAGGKTYHEPQTATDPLASSGGA